jgi:hypothetical protein
MAYKETTVIDAVTSTDNYVATKQVIHKNSISIFLSGITNNMLYKIDAVVKGIAVEIVAEATLTAGTPLKHDFTDVAWEEIQISFKASVAATHGVLTAVLAERD